MNLLLGSISHTQLPNIAPVWQPHDTLTSAIARALMNIEAALQQVAQIAATLLARMLRRPLDLRFIGAGAGG